MHWFQEDYEAFQAYSTPEIHRVTLDGLILQMVAMGLPDARKWVLCFTVNHSFILSTESVTQEKRKLEHIEYTYNEKHALFNLDIRLWWACVISGLLRAPMYFLHFFFFAWCFHSSLQQMEDAPLCVVALNWNYDNASIFFLGAVIFSGNHSHMHFTFSSITFLILKPQ